nr:hypothetical protein [uncultured Carboxylicivirga sp.]
MKMNNENDFLIDIKDSFKTVLEKIDTFVEQASNTNETQKLFKNLEKANEIFNDLMQEKIDSVKKIINK